MTPIPLSLYVHIPWCVKKCPYCDFNSHEARTDLNEERYINALLRDLESELPNIWGRPIESIFIGGGTPSLFSSDSIDKLLQGLRERLPIKPNTEITLEANPGTFEQEKFGAFYDSGINRLSIGVQSFSNTKLKSLGRIHGAEEALNAADIATKAGFKNFNIDLMFGLPKQTIDQALNDLQQAIEKKPTHISWYQLTIEENTLFYHSPPSVPNGDLLWEMSEKGQELLTKQQYNQYEISAYSNNSNQCKHNINYWEFGDYLGIGAGAHGKLSMPDKTITRHTKYKHPEKYMEMALKGEPRSNEIRLKERDLRFEFMLNAIRLKSGFSKELFENRTFLSINSIEKALTEIIDDDLMTLVNGHYTTTSKGWAFINNIVERIL